MEVDMEETVYSIQGVNGPIITVTGGRGLGKMTLVRVGHQRLPGEVVDLHGQTAVVQVYEDSAGLGAGQPVYATGMPLSVTLGPGMIGTTYDGIARPLKAIEGVAGDFIPKGVDVPSLDMDRKWDVTVQIKEGDSLSPGQIFAVRRNRRPLSTGAWCRRGFPAARWM